MGANEQRESTEEFGMKKIMVLVTMTAVAIVLNFVPVETADGRTEYFKQFKELYKDSKVIDEAKTKTKCHTCHVGKKKKDRNDYGIALSKHLTKDLRKKLRKNKVKYYAKIKESLKEVEKAKSVSGVPFGKLIEAGKMPGTPPEEKEEEEEEKEEEKKEEEEKEEDSE
jgi:hypothetical protein